MTKIDFNKEIQSVDPKINEESIINDTIFELTDENEIDVLFRLYDKLKNKIPPGVIIRNGDNGVGILNEAEYKTHAYLIANSKNFLTGDSMMYSIDEVNTLMIQLETLKTRLIELNSQASSAFTIVESFSSVIDSLNKSITNLLSSQDNYDKYSKAFIDFYISVNNFTIQNINNIINGMQIEKNKQYLDTYSTDGTSPLITD